MVAGPAAIVDRERREVLLAASPLGRGLSKAALREIAVAATCRSHAAGTVLFREGEPAMAFYLVSEGQVRLSQLAPDGHQVILHHCGPGAGIGIIVVLSAMAYPVTALCLEPTTVIVWDRETALYLMERFPRLALNGLDLVARRFAELQSRFRELATERVEQRVARALLRLVRVAGRKVPEGVVIDMPLSRQDVAEMTGTTLYTVSRIFSRWEQEGWIRSGRERITLCRPHDIVVIAEDLPT